MIKHVQRDGVKKQDDKIEKGTIVVLEVDNSKVLPLVMQTGVQDDIGVHINECQYNNGPKNNIKKVAMEGDLSPKKIYKIKDTHSKRKKKRVAGYATNQENSR